VEATGSLPVSAAVRAGALETDPASAMISTESGSGSRSGAWRDGDITNHVSNIRCTASESRNSQLSILVRCTRIAGRWLLLNIIGSFRS